MFRAVFQPVFRPVLHRLREMYARATVGFHTGSYDQDTFESAVQLIGKGTPSTDHTSDIYAFDHEGKAVLFETDEPVWKGARVVENLAPYSEDFTNVAWFKEGATSVSVGNVVTLGVGGANELFCSIPTTGRIGRTFVMRVSFPPATGEVTLALLGGAESNVTLDPNNTVIGARIQTFTSGSFGFNARIAAVGSPVTIPDGMKVQIEEVTSQANQNPSEYVPRLGSAVALQAFHTENGNTVASNIVTEAAGDLLEPQPLMVSQGAFENKQLQSNDQTDAEYTPTNITPSKDQTGLDGKPNNACKLLATAANGTVIGSAITAASGTHAIAVYLQRDTGSGDIDLTLDNGSTWTTVPVTAAMNRFLLDQAALTNPQMGTRIVTDTDAVIPGNYECYLNTTAEELKLLNGPIYTAGTSVAIDAVRPTFDTENHTNTSGQYSGYFEFLGPDIDIISIAGVPILKVENGICILHDGTYTATVPAIIGVNHFVVTYNAAAETMDLYLNGQWASEVYGTSFVSVWRTTTPAETLTFPATGTNNFVVDWGDGSSETVTSASPTHEYATPGYHVVTIDGACSKWFQNNGGDKTAIYGVLNLGDVGWSELDAAFYGCSNMAVFVVGSTDASIITDMSRMMRGWGSITMPPDLSNLDTGVCTSMSYMMYGWTSITTPPVLTNFDTSVCENMSYMMYGWTSITTPPDLSNLDTGVCTSMSYMMRGWGSITMPPDLSNLDTGVCTSMSYMMYGWTSITTPPDLSNLDTGACLDMAFMMYNWNSITTPPVLTSFDTSVCENMSYMMYGWTSITTPPVLSNFDTGECLNMYAMMRGWGSITMPPDLSNLDTGVCTSMSYMMYGWTSITTPPDLSNLDTGACLDMAFMMYNWNSITTPPVLTSFDTSACTTMASMMRGWTSLSEHPSIAHFLIPELLDATDMMTTSGMSTANYDATFVAWEGQVYKPNVTANFGTSKYDTATTERGNMVADGWIISDDGPA